MTADTRTAHPLGGRSDIIIVIGVVGILVVLFSPIPPALLDFLLIANFSFALLILLLTFYVDRPLSFSTFPSLLLIATLFRLSLNVAATRLILSDAYAGDVIDAVGSYVVAGNYVIGLVVFTILIVVQYVVVTNGAQRVAEVAARFTLDAMPGKQMSIDADLNMGLIDEAEARKRRNEIEREANFYGAMDGASKFVKGDAIAGIIIILIDIVGGLSIGMMQRGMGWGEALQTYTLLTVGDGIVTQIPALVIATGTGIIVTRAATDAELSDEITRQITRHPRSLVMLLAALTVALILPGIPAVPVLMLLAVVGLVTFLAIRYRDAERVSTEESDAGSGDEEESDLYSAIEVDPIEVAVGEGLVPLLGDEQGVFMRRVKTFRKQYAGEFGFVLPQVRVRSTARLTPKAYVIRFYGTDMASGSLMPDRHLAISAGREPEGLDGIETKDPTFGLPAQWVTEMQAQRARDAGCTVVEPVTVLVTHFSEVVRANAAELLSRQETERLVNRVRERQPTLVEELLPNVLGMGDVQKVLQHLLREKVPIKNMEFVLEALLEFGKETKEVALLTEGVRERLGPAICQRLKTGEGELQVLTLDPATERMLRESLQESEGGRASLVLDPEHSERLMRQLSRATQEMMQKNLMPVLLCPASLRRHVRALCERLVPHLSVLALNEVPHAAAIKSYGTVSIH